MGNNIPRSAAPNIREIFMFAIIFVWRSYVSAFSLYLLLARSLRNEWIFFKSIIHSSMNKGAFLHAHAKTRRMRIRCERDSFFLRVDSMRGARIRARGTAMTER